MFTNHFSFLFAYFIFVSVLKFIQITNEDKFISMPKNWSTGKHIASKSKWKISKWWKNLNWYLN